MNSASLSGCLRSLPSSELAFQVTKLRGSDLLVVIAHLRSLHAVGSSPEPLARLLGSGAAGWKNRGFMRDAESLEARGETDRARDPSSVARSRLVRVFAPRKDKFYNRAALQLADGLTVLTQFEPPRRPLLSRRDDGETRYRALADDPGAVRGGARDVPRGRRRAFVRGLPRRGLHQPRGVSHRDRQGRIASTPAGAGTRSWTTAATAGSRTRSSAPSP